MIISLQWFCDIDEDEIRQRLNELPDDLNDLYDKLLMSRSTVRTSKDVPISDCAFRLLLCLQTPLDAPELLWAIKVCLNQEDDISEQRLFKSCQNLIVRGSTEGGFTLLHASVHEFLKQKPQFHSQRCHETASLLCLRSMLKEDVHLGLHKVAEWEKARDCTASSNQASIGSLTEIEDTISLLGLSSDDDSSAEPNIYERWDGRGSSPNLDCSARYSGQHDLGFFRDLSALPDMLPSEIDEIRSQDLLEEQSRHKRGGDFALAMADFAFLESSSESSSSFGNSDNDNVIIPVNDRSIFLNSYNEFTTQDLLQQSDECSLDEYTVQYLVYHLQTLRGWTVEEPLITLLDAFCFQELPKPTHFHVWLQRLTQLNPGLPHPFSSGLAHQVWSFNVADPLYFACALDIPDILRTRVMMNDHAADMYLTSGPKDLTPLDVAVQYGNLETVKCLVQTSGSLGPRRSGRPSPLDQAVRLEHEELIRFLLDEGALEQHGQNEALNIAVSHGNVNRVRLLLSYGASVDCLAPSAELGQISAVDIAVTKGNRTMVLLLVSQKRNPPQYLHSLLEQAEAYRLMRLDIDNRQRHLSRIIRRRG